MEYIRLGSTGLKVSRICLGCMSYGRSTDRWPWVLDEEHSRPFIKRALDLGSISLTVRMFIHSGRVKR